MLVFELELKTLFVSAYSLHCSWSKHIACEKSLLRIVCSEKATSISLFFNFPTRHLIVDLDSEPNDLTFPRSDYHIVYLKPTENLMEILKDLEFIHSGHAIVWCASGDIRSVGYAKTPLHPIHKLLSLNQAKKPQYSTGPCLTMSRLRTLLPRICQCHP